MSENGSKEIRLHSTPFKPFSYYRSNIPEYFPNVPLHWHSELELNYILEGSGEFVCGKERFVSSPGDIVILLPNMPHAIYPVNDSIHIYDTLVFNSSMIGSHDNDRETDECIRPLINNSCGINPHITKTNIYYDELKTTTENIIAAAKGDSPRLDMLMKSELLRLFWLLGESKAIYHKDISYSRKKDFIRPVLEFINENFTENITIELLSQKAHTCQSYFMSEFKRATGVSALEYVNQLRLKTARELLIDTGKSVSEIAYECGFHNLSNFNRLFRAMSGCSPNDYRKRQQHS